MRRNLMNLLYFDLDSDDVRSAQHARCDKGMVGVADPLRNARMVQFSQRGETCSAEAALLEPLDLDVVSENPFEVLRALAGPTAS
jgi:hypothetical protein